MDYSSAPRITAILHLTPSYCDRTFDCSYYRYIRRYSSTSQQQMECISSSQVRWWEANTEPWFFGLAVLRSTVGSVKITVSVRTPTQMIFGIKLSLFSLPQYQKTAWIIRTQHEWSISFRPRPVTFINSIFSPCIHCNLCFNIYSDIHGKWQLFHNYKCRDNLNLVD